ncbi:hypothetical protein BXZ70DRAFT_1005714 [Cristinia sonorae]|uniref:F-box domain-containing protein n=1 Tax=Cristinia sonorae TaxID=1940300 RepID=A0A8K0USR8_9AGAR|nr:hypothetical protein BXZ70DRAFT_1005714 [Cristinia sonorae]
MAKASKATNSSRVASTKRKPTEKKPAASKKKGKADSTTPSATPKVVSRTDPSAQPSTNAVTHRVPATEYFPLELIICTMEHAQNDPWTIRKCMLVCKSWYRFARQLIYHTVVLNSQQQLGDFLQFIDKNPDVRGWIRRLELQGRMSYRDRWQSGEEDMVLLADQLTGLRALEFNWVFPEWLKKVQFPEIRRLVLHSSYTVTSTLDDMLANYPRLSSLDIIGGRCTTAPGQLSLHHLMLSSFLNHEMEAFFKSLQLTPTVNTLRSLVLRVCMLKNTHMQACMEMLQDFLNAMAGQLVELELLFTSTDPKDSFWEKELKMNTVPLSLARLTKLQNLTLGAPLHPMVKPLISTQLPFLRRITFSMEFDNPRSIRPAKFSELDDMLCDSTQFSALEGVVIKYSGPLHIDTVTDRLESSFTQLYRGGMLRVVKSRTTIHIWKL